MKEYYIDEKKVTDWDYYRYDLESCVRTLFASTGEIVYSHRMKNMRYHGMHFFNSTRTYMPKERIYKVITLK